MRALTTVAWSGEFLLLIIGILITSFLKNFVIISWIVFIRYLRRLFIMLIFFFFYFFDYVSLSKDIVIIIFSFYFTQFKFPLRISVVVIVITSIKSNYQSMTTCCPSFCNLPSLMISAGSNLLLNDIFILKCVKITEKLVCIETLVIPKASFVLLFHFYKQCLVEVDSENPLFSFVFTVCCQNQSFWCFFVDSGKKLCK